MNPKQQTQFKIRNRCWQEKSRDNSAAVGWCGSGGTWAAQPQTVAEVYGGTRSKERRPVTYWGTGTELSGFGKHQTITKEEWRTNPALYGCAFMGVHQGSSDLNRPNTWIWINGWRFPNFLFMIALHAYFQAGVNSNFGLIYLLSASLSFQNSLSCISSPHSAQGRTTQESVKWLLWSEKIGTQGECRKTKKSWWKHKPLYRPSESKPGRPDRKLSQICDTKNWLEITLPINFRNHFIYFYRR